MDHLCYLCHVIVMLLRLFIAALWSPGGKGLTSWLLFVMFIVVVLLSHVVSVTIQNGWNNRISYGCVYAQIRSGLGMHLVTFSNHDTVLFLLIVPIKGRFV